MGGKSTKQRRVTAKQRKLIKGIVRGKTQTQAALEAGYGATPASACSTASEVLRRPNVQRALEAALDKAGATLDKSAEVVAAAMDATKKDGDNDAPDHAIRLKAAELSGRWRGIHNQEEPGLHGDRISLAVLILNERERRGLEPLPAKFIDAKVVRGTE